MTKMYLDDIRCPPNNDWVIVRSSDEAIEWIKKNGTPDFFSFDHDLGQNDTTMIFLHRFVNECDPKNVPNYYVHSANPVGKLNIIAFMESWKKSKTL